MRSLDVAKRNQGNPNQETIKILVSLIALRYIKATGKLNFLLSIPICFGQEMCAYPSSICVDPSAPTLSRKREGGQDEFKSLIIYKKILKQLTPSPACGRGLGLRDRRII
jgi:hypothetical protein